VIATDAYFPNDRTSNGEAKDTEDEGKIKMMKARSNNRQQAAVPVGQSHIDVRPGLKNLST